MTASGTIGKPDDTSRRSLAELCPCIMAILNCRQNAGKKMRFYKRKCENVSKNVAAPLQKAQNLHMQYSCFPRHISTPTFCLRGFHCRVKDLNYAYPSNFLRLTFSHMQSSTTQPFVDIQRILYCIKDYLNPKRHSPYNEQ